jgi:peptide methionine sulfoxide reductase MsrB
MTLSCSITCCENLDELLKLDSSCSYLRTDQEVNWENVRVLPDGESVSVDGTHLGHNLPDGSGSRYCINLVSVAGNPSESM